MDPSTSSPPQQDSLRAKKRKLQDAFQTLDDAVQGPSTKQKQTPQPSVFKKTHLSRSIYTTLQKYGISKGPKSQSAPLFARSSTAPELTAKAPHLSAILSRAASRAKSVFTFKFGSEDLAPLPTSAEYSPSSLPSFLSRLETFKLATYSNKPQSIDAVAASRCGWTNDGKDRLVCGFCNASWVVAGRESMNRDAANALVEKQRQGLVDNHKTGCPWKTRQCDASIYCVPLKTPTAMLKDLKSNASILDPLVGDIGIRHPLTPSQLSSLKKTMAFESTISQEGQDDSLKENDANAMDVDEPPSDQHKPSLSEAAILVSIFGWSLAPPSSNETPRRASTSASISASRAPSRQGTPSRAVAPSASTYTSISRPGTPVGRGSRSASVSRGNTSASPVSAAPSLFKMPSSLTSDKEKALLQCSLCQRRVGLWAFAPRKPEDVPPLPTNPLSGQDAPTNDTPASATPPRPKKTLPQRQFDLLKEHRSYCPYVVKSTVVPTLSTSPSDPKSRPSAGHSRSSSSLSQHNLSVTNGAIEGWRAVLAVVLRYGMAQRHRVEYDVFSQNDANAGAPTESAQEVDNVKAMVAGVKEQGGRELLKYVKGLLG